MANKDEWVVRVLLASNGIDVNLKGLSNEALRWMAYHNFVNPETVESVEDQESVESQESVELPVPQRRKRRLLCLSM